jgi:sulfite reductase (ferredoxin)
MTDTTDARAGERGPECFAPNAWGRCSDEPGPPERPTWATAEEIDTFDEFVQRFWRGEISPDEFKRFRLQNGIYGQRQAGEQMVRVKIPWGGLTSNQLEVLADIAAESPRGVGHVTTRQNVQFHFIKLDRVVSVMDRLAAVGLTTREACGNTVRNVTVGHCAGVCPEEVFDVTPYAEAVARFLLRNAMNQNLPRKFKIAFSGCPDDLGLSAIHDIGARAICRPEGGEEKRGFQLYVGGGLGPSPRMAQLLEEFTGVDALLPTVAAIVRVFDRLGNRENRNLARMKFVLGKLGIEKFRALVVQERAGLVATMAGHFPAIVVWRETPRQEASVASAPMGESGDVMYLRWRASNVVGQKQAGCAMVHVRLELGDITPTQLRTLAFAARRFGDGTARTTNQQNFVVRWVQIDDLASLYRILASVGLAEPSAERFADVTACPGAETCQLGITSSRGLAAALGDRFRNGLRDVADESGIRIKISGCPNSCGQHHIANIGFYGGAKKFHDQQAPTYQMLLGGGLELGEWRYAKPVARVPAKNIPDAVDALVGIYRRERGPDERFNQFLSRYGLDGVRAALKPFTELPSAEEAPDGYVDYHSEETFVVRTGQGECAA